MFPKTLMRWKSDALQEVPAPTKPRSPSNGTPPRENRPGCGATKARLLNGWSAWGCRHKDTTRSTHYERLRDSFDPRAEYIFDGIRETELIGDFGIIGGGGGFFSVGSIAWTGSLSHNDYDNNVARLTTNVLRRFRDPETLK